MTALLTFLIVIGVLIFFHEFGHFLLARLMGVGVETFSLGFGPRLFGKKRGRTDYRISAIPLGGYVKMVGEEPDAEIEPEDIPLSFTHKPIWRRALIVAAGPVFNLILAVLIFFVMKLSFGVYVLKPVVGGVQKGMPAEAAGILPGDLITGIDGSPVDNWYDMREIITMSQGRPLSLTIFREGESLVISLTPREKIETMFGAEMKSYLVGIQSGSDGFFKPLGVPEAFVESIRETGKQIRMVFIGVYRLIEGSESRKNIGGPITVAKMSEYSFNEGGVPGLLYFTAFFSIMLAILNLLPIPVLDGGHLLFFLIEAVTRRPVNMRLREIAQAMGFFFLILLMGFAVFNDISRLFTG